MTWERVPLKELGDWYGGGTPSKSNPAFWTDGDVPWLSPKDMGPEVLHGTQDHVTSEAVSGSSTKLVPAGSVAVVTRSGILERTIPVSIVPFATTMNQDMKAVVPRAGIDPRWIAWGLRAFERDLLRDTRKAGTTVASIEMPRWYGFKLPVPPLEEQRRIVAILEDQLSRLDAADSYLAAASRRLAALQDRLIRRAVTGADFGAGVATELPAVGTDDGLLPPLPADWEWARLGDVADVAGGVTKDAKKQNDPSFVEVPYLRVANVQRGHLNLDTVTTIRVPPARAEALRLRRGDVLLNEGGDRDKLARGWVWDGQIDDCIHQNHVFRARITDARLTPEFLSFTANSFGGPWAERNGKQSVNLASISLRVIRQMPVIVPARGEAEAAVSRLTKQLAGTARLRAGIDVARARCTALRRSLLAAAFSGRLTGSSTEMSVVEGRVEA